MKKRISKTICITLVAVLCIVSVNAQNKNSSEGWVLSWCAPTAYDFLGSSEPTSDLWVAIRFTPEDLAEKGVNFGDKLTKIRFIANNDDNRITSADIQIYIGGIDIHLPGTLIYTQSVEPSSIVNKNWTEIDLLVPIVIDISEEFWIGYRLVSVAVPGANHIAGYDAGPAVWEKGNLGTTIPADFDHNWNLEGFVVSNNPVLCVPVNDLVSEKRSNNCVLLSWSEPESSLPVEEYWVYRRGEEEKRRKGEKQKSRKAEEEKSRKEFELVGVTKGTTFLDEDLQVGEYEYYVVAHYEMGCVADSSNHVKVEIDLGVKGVKELGGVILYPNPTTGELTIDNGQLTINNVEIFDVYGRKILVPTLTVLRSYNLTVLQPGIYFVRVGFEGGGSVKKVVKQ